MEELDHQYNIGHTAPPKSHGGIIAVLLIVIIFLGGVISILGLLNISLFQKLLKKDQESLAVAVRKEDDHGSALDVTYSDEIIFLNDVPQSVDYYPQEGGLSLQEIYQKTEPSLVSVETEDQNGTGIVLTKNGYILTNNYLVTGAEKINIHFKSGEKLPATVVGKDGFSDLAVLRVEANDLTPAIFGDSSTLRVGDVVVAMSSNVGTGVMADGIVSAINTDIEAGGGKMTLIQTSATLDYEQVGGVLINCHGYIVGMNTYCASNIMTLTGTERVSFSLDSVTMKNVADQLMNHGFVEGRIHLGIHGQEIDEFYQHYYDIPRGIFITAVEEESVLFQRGVREGDILLEMAGTPVFNFETLNSLLSSIDREQEITVIIYRDGTQHHVKLTIGEK